MRLIDRACGIHRLICFIGAQVLRISKGGGSGGGYKDEDGGVPIPVNSSESRGARRET